MKLTFGGGERRPNLRQEVAKLRQTVETLGGFLWGAYSPAKGEQEAGLLRRVTLLEQRPGQICTQCQATIKKGRK